MAGAYIRASKVRPSAKYRPPGRDVMRQVGEALATKVVVRTLSGLDERGRAFEPYEGPKAGKPVDLMESGAMLEGFGVIEVGPKTVKIGWRSRKLKQRAAFHQEGTVNLPERPFVGVPLAWVRLLLQRLWRPVK